MQKLKQVENLISVLTFITICLCRKLSKFINLLIWVHIYLFSFIAYSSVQLLSPVWLFGTPWTAARRLPLPSETPRALSKSCPSSQWRNPTISSSLIPFFSCLQSFPASGSFPMSQFFESGGQSIGASASASVLPMNIQGWFSFGLTGLISLQSKGLSKSSPTPQFKSINSSMSAFFMVLR